MLTRRKESDTYIARVDSSRWKYTKYRSLQPALWPSSAEEEYLIYKNIYIAIVVIIITVICGFGSQLDSATDQQMESRRDNDISSILLQINFLN